MITFEQAVKMALGFDARDNKFAEYENSFEFWWDCGVEMDEKARNGYLVKVDLTQG